MNVPNAEGLAPTVTVAVTVFVDVSIVDTVPSPEFATTTVDPSGVTDTPMGATPTATVAITESDAASITDTVLSPLFVT